MKLVVKLVVMEEGECSQRLDQSMCAKSFPTRGSTSLSSLASTQMVSTFIICISSKASNERMNTSGNVSQRWSCYAEESMDEWLHFLQMVKSFF
jgi:hypothetical protein